MPSGRHKRKLTQQRERRQSMRRIDCYPSQHAAEVIDRLICNGEDGDYSTVIDRIIEALLPK